MTAAVRRAREDDGRAIAELHVRAWRAAYRGLLPDEVLAALDVDANERRRRRRLAAPAPGARDWVLEEAGRVVGWAATGRARDDDLGALVHELYAIYLEPSHVGRGLGRALLEHCLRDAIERGCEEMVMWVLVGNERAQRFYAAAGFAPDPRVPDEPFRDTGCLKRRLARPLP